MEMDQKMLRHVLEEDDRVLDLYGYKFLNSANKKTAAVNCGSLIIFCLFVLRQSYIVLYLTSS